MAAQISNVRLFLNKIADDIGSEDLESLKYLCTDILRKAKLEKIKTARELFVAIGEVTEGDEKQLDLLKGLFRAVRRFDLESEVEKFQHSTKGKSHWER